MPENETTRRRHSPGYPALDLKTAIERTVELYRVAPKHPVPFAVAADEWGFSPKSSSTKIVAAALKRFGLVQDVGSAAGRQLALTEEGREIAFSYDDRESDRWHELIRAAAMRPKIHRQVIDHFGLPLPDDRVVLRYMLFDLGFHNEASARDFLGRLKATLDFAKVEPEGDVASSAPGSAATQEEPDDLDFEPAHSPQWNVSTRGVAERASRPVPPEPSIYDHFRAHRSFVQIPYSAGEWATLQASFPLSEQEWAAMIAMLQAMKPGLVTAE